MTGVFLCIIVFALYSIIFTINSWLKDIYSWVTSDDIGANSTNSTSTTSKVPANVPDDLDNILMYLSKGEIKDPVTQEIFYAGETVYLCHRHRLAYHEDSWQEMGCKCMVCGNDAHTKVHILSREFEINLAE
jgi:hypothetical protein